MGFFQAHSIMVMPLIGQYSVEIRADDPIYTLNNTRPKLLRKVYSQEQGCSLAAGNLASLHIPHFFGSLVHSPLSFRAQQDPSLQVLRSRRVINYVLDGLSALMGRASRHMKCHIASNAVLQYHLLGNRYDRCRNRSQRSIDYPGSVVRSPAFQPKVTR